MSRAIAIRFYETGARAVLVEDRSGRLTLVSEAEVAWDAEDDNARGRQLAGEIAAWKPSRTPVVAALARKDLKWQNFELPPAPEEDLADLVHLQSDRDQAVGEVTALDFLPLQGNAEQSYRIWAVVASQKTISSLKAICSGANLTLASLAPLELGWPLLISAAQRSGERTAVSDPELTAATTADKAIVWANHGDQLQLLRTAPLPAGSAEAAMTALSGELRRTALTLGSLGSNAPARWLLLCEASECNKLEELAKQWPQEADVAEINQWLSPEETGPLLTAETAPLAGLAAELAAGRPLALDLLHPRERPRPQSRTRTLALAAVALVTAVGAVVWQGYRNLQAPLDAAVAATAETDELTPMIESLADDVEQRQRVANWLAASPNLMDAITTLSRRLRPLELENDAFVVDQDATVTRLTQADSSFTVATVIPNVDVAGAVENRLRDDRLQVSRQRLEKADAAPAGYEHRLVIQIQKLPESAVDDGEAP